MVETISPVVHGGRSRSYWTAIALHALGATLSSALLGAVLGGLGWLLGAPWGDGGYLLIAAVALLYFARESFKLPIPLPQLRRQVPDWWRTYYSKNVAALLYGLGLGVAFMTYLSFGTFAVVSAAVMASGDAAIGALTIGAFGLTRGLGVALNVPVDRLDGLAETQLPRSINAVLIALVGVVALLALT